MGSSSSKFKKYLQHGDEFAAMQLYHGSPELRKNLDPNLSYGENHSHNTALHYAAKHGMKHLLRTFLIDLGGNPNKRNGFNETVLHAACQLEQQKNSYSAQERRAACVTLLLQWKGATLNTGGREKADLNAQDQKGNTALHWAASTGLKRCVELLVSQHGSALFVENNDKLTPCDLAMRNNHHDIARFLEARMVFADNNDNVNEDLLAIEKEEQEVYRGLRTQDLQEAKDQLLVETSDMLHIPLFTAEALLRNNEWSREALLEKWIKDPVQCCQLAGVQVPASALHKAGSIELTLSSAHSSIDSDDIKNKPEILCEICFTNLPVWDQHITMFCKHNFCSHCWERYLNIKIEEGDAHHIECPAYQCHVLVPVEFIEKLVSPDMARRYLQFDIKAFVETNKSFKWCPVAGCGRAVRLPETEQEHAIPEDGLNNSDFKPPLSTSHAVDCGNSHFFCWECLDEAHAPCGCAQWRQWQHKISEIKPEELRADCDETEAAANFLWLVTNSKPCPNCKSPIQKNEGCNHMKCSKCKFDFCWVCQEAWKRHSSATGGYFRCNRFEAVNKADEKQGSLLTEAVVRNSQLQELTRFLHYYTRFKNHENSRKLEEPLLTGVRRKMEILANSLLSKECSEKDTKFVEDGVRELLKARQILCGSYVYGYYLEDNGYNRIIFEFMQNELEEVTEKLSEIIARPYLRTPKSVIIQTTALVRRKRHEFVQAVSKGLIPPETPPSLRKVRKRRYPGNIPFGPKLDSTINHALDASLKHLDPNNLWVKDSQGRHNNLTAIYDWPDYDSDEETEVNRALTVSLLGECKRHGCNRPKARNPRTGAMHQYCSLRCSKSENLENEVYKVPVSSDYNMDLVIALEMSRLQMIEDKMKQVADSKLNPGPGTSDSLSRSNSDNIIDTLEDQVELAIQLSLQEATNNTNQLSRQIVSHHDFVSISTQTPERTSSPLINLMMEQSNFIGCYQCNKELSEIVEYNGTNTGGFNKLTDKLSHNEHHFDFRKELAARCENCHSPLPSIYHSCGHIYDQSITIVSNEDIFDGSSKKTREDLTVDYFLKSLADKHLDDYDLKCTVVNSNNEYDPGFYKSNEKELLGFLKTPSNCSTRNEDGHFQISDIHESGYIELVKDDIVGDVFDDQDNRLKRSHSTGDLISRRSKLFSRAGLATTSIPTDELKYHLDSDHSSNHDDKCEDFAKRIMALPSSFVNTKHFLLSQHQKVTVPGGNQMMHNGSQSYLFNQNSSSIEEPSVTYYQGSSLEETTTSDSVQVDDLKEPEKKVAVFKRQDSFDGDSEMSFDKKLDEDVLSTVSTVKSSDNSIVSQMGSFELRSYKKSPKCFRKEPQFFDNSFKKQAESSSLRSDVYNYFHSKSKESKQKFASSQASSKSEGSFVVETEVPQETTSSSKMNPLACLKAKLCSAHLPKTSYLTKLAVNKSIGILSHSADSSISNSPKQKAGNRKKNSNNKNESSKNDSNCCDSNRKTFKLSSGKSISQNLRIKISKSPNQVQVSNSPAPQTSTAKVLETDSSNEYESETGIPKSPTLYISGVSISRTPEQKNPSQSLNTLISNSSGKNSRSSSLTVPVTMSVSPLSDMNSSSNVSLNVSCSPEPYTPTLARSTTPQSSYSNLKDLRGSNKSPSPSKTFFVMEKENCPITRMSRSNGSTPSKSSTVMRGRANSNVTTKGVTSPVATAVKSKSANEPEREREVFRFPKSSTDGALSSVLHVQESNLSSDDFHEALFLLERSPKMRDSKRRKKLKKKDPDCFKKEEASSIL